MTYIPHETLLIRISNGNQEAFTELYEHTKQETYRLVYFLAAHKGEVDDIVNEVYLALYKSLSSYNREQSFQAWFNGLIVRQVKSHKRKAWRVWRLFDKLQQHVNENDYLQSKDSERLVEEDEMLHYVSKLNEKYKEIIVLRYYKQLSLEEIADIVNVPLGTIKSRHHYALKQLRQYYSHFENRKEHVSYEFGK